MTYALTLRVWKGLETIAPTYGVIVVINGDTSIESNETF